MIEDELSAASNVRNPFRPGAGHMPPYLAGRDDESRDFHKLLSQDPILANLVLTGLRGIGKTVLLDAFKPAAIESGWLWAGTDMSESTSVTEENIAIRLLTDLSVVTGSLVIEPVSARPIGFSGTDPAPQPDQTFNYAMLSWIYETTPGLVADKLKAVLESVWPYVEAAGKRGIVFAYDEAQNLADHAAKQQYPLSLLLDVFQSLQRKGIRMMLALAGLPTLFPKLVEARTFAERMFHTIFLTPLTESETADAIKKPIDADPNCPLKVGAGSIRYIWSITRGYPYFVQYVCRESFDVLVQAIKGGQPLRSIPIREILRKLDIDFFAGRWARATDRQQDLLRIVATLPTCDAEFSVLEIIASPANKELAKPFSGSHVNQMFTSLAEAGLVYKSRHGKYAFAVPLLGDFIKRQSEPPEPPPRFSMPPLSPVR
ncbi:MAG: ATP-binding protein [Acidobacteriota bacterium]